MEFSGEDGTDYTFYPEVAPYLEVGGTDPDDILVAPYIPRLIGGIKSVDFAIRDYDHTDDAPPASPEVDISTIELSSETAGSFFDLFKAAESQADEQYDVALFETRQKLADAALQNVYVDTLFVPGTVNSPATGYFRRLQRLAQDTDLIVVTLVDDSEGSSYYRLFEPIRTDDVGAYWDARARRMGEPVLNMSAETEPDDFTVASVLGINEVPHEEFNRDRWGEHDVVRQNIRSMSQASASALCSWVSSEGGLLSAALPEIQKIAFDTTPQTASAIKQRQAARDVLAKIGDIQGLQVIIKEAVKRIGSAGSESETIAPLSLYVRRDPVLRDAIVATVEADLAPGSNNSPATLAFLGALYRSHDPALAQFFTRHLTNIPDMDRNVYGQTVLHAAARWMPDYVSILHETPASIDHSAALATLQEAAVFFINAYVDGRLEGAQQSMTFGPQRIGDMLLSFGEAAFEQPLKRLVLALFKEGGSVLTDNTFERLYVGYRKQYGDLPEISRLFQSCR